MFNQEYRNLTTLTKLVENGELKANTVYYLSIIPENKLIVKKDNSSYEILPEQQLVYNPLDNATIEGYNGNIYEIENLIKDKVVSKIQVEFIEKNNSEVLSRNSIFINTDEIRGYKQSENIYSFETIDDVANKIRYLGIVGRDLNSGEITEECIILNYYTTDLLRCLVELSTFIFLSFFLHFTIILTFLKIISALLLNFKVLIKTRTNYKIEF